MYSVVWKYIVKEENQMIFETEYGKQGTWAKLFSDSESYLGSILSIKEDSKSTYLLIDNWADKKSYDSFKIINSVIYNRLSSEFETLYENEEKIGEFNSIN